MPRLSSFLRFSSIAGAAALAASGLTAALAPTATAAAPLLAPGDIVASVYGDAGRSVMRIPAYGGPATPVVTGLGTADGVAVDATGDIYVSDTMQDQVLRISADGSSRTPIGSGLSKPGDVAVDPTTGDLLIADIGNDRLVRVPADGGPQTQVPVPMDEDQGLPAYEMSAIGVDPTTGDVLVDSYPAGVFRIDADTGTPTQITNVWVHGIDFNTDGAEFVLDTTGVFRIDKDGSDHRQTGDYIEGNVTGLALDAQGRYLVSGNNQLVRITAPSLESEEAETLALGGGNASDVDVFTPPPTFTALTPPATIKAGQPFSYTFTTEAVDNQPAPTYGLTSGNLPTGLTLDPHTGNLTGTPTTPGSYTFQLRAYNAATQTLSPHITIDVRDASAESQTVDFPTPGDTVFGAPERDLQATASSGLPVTFTSLTPSTCSVIDGKAVRSLAAGTCSIEASQAGNADYMPADPVVRTFSIAKAPIDVATSATPGLLSLLTRRTVYTTRVTSAITGRPVAGVPVQTEIAGHRPALGCPAVTDAAGVATCTVRGSVTLTGRITATAAETDNHLGGVGYGWQTLF